MKLPWWLRRFWYHHVRRDEVANFFDHIGDRRLVEGKRMFLLPGELRLVNHRTNELLDVKRASPGDTVRVRALVDVQDEPHCAVEVWEETP